MCTHINYHVILHTVIAGIRRGREDQNASPPSREKVSDTNNYSCSLCGCTHVIKLIVDNF